MCYNNVPPFTVLFPVLLFRVPFCPGVPFHFPLTVRPFCSALRSLQAFRSPSVSTVPFLVPPFHVSFSVPWFRSSVCPVQCPTIPVLVSFSRGIPFCDVLFSTSTPLIVPCPLPLFPLPSVQCPSVPFRIPFFPGLPFPLHSSVLLHALFRTSFNVMSFLSSSRSLFGVQLLRSAFRSPIVLCSFFSGLLCRFVPRSVSCRSLPAPVPPSVSSYPVSRPALW